MAITRHYGVDCQNPEQRWNRFLYRSQLWRILRLRFAPRPVYRQNDPPDCLGRVRADLDSRLAFQKVRELISAFDFAATHTKRNDESMRS